MSAGSDATAVAYVETTRSDGTVKWGVERSMSRSSRRRCAVVSAVNRRQADDEVIEQHEPVTGTVRGGVDTARSELAAVLVVCRRAAVPARQRGRRGAPSTTTGRRRRRRSTRPSARPASAITYFPDLGNGGYDVEHYDLALTVDPAGGGLVGHRPPSTPSPPRTLGAYDLDLVGLDVASMTRRRRRRRRRRGRAGS